MALSLLCGVSFGDALAASNRASGAEPFSDASTTAALRAPTLDHGSGARRPADMVEGARHAGPLGWRKLCDREAEVCAPTAAPRPGAVVTLDMSGHDQLARFNARMNAAFRPALDPEAYGEDDLWRTPEPGEAADCEDFALAKRAKLIAAGWPAEAVLIAVVKGDSSPYHAVLVLRTDQGEVVLDNLTDAVKGWRESGYEWVVRQSAWAPETWVRVQEAEAQASR